MRPADLPALRYLVETYAADANAHQRQMFADSLHAALTLAEVGDLLRQVGLPPEWVRATSDRHWTISGVLECGDSSPRWLRRCIAERTRGNRQ
jgi:hypothetical protein